MKLNGLHLLLTYQCTFECDHCFAWGSPWQSGTMTLDQIRLILHRAQEMDSVKWIFFEGGEPFLYYPVLVKGVEMAAQAGYKVGIVSNAYWATSLEDALEWLNPMARYVKDLAVSSDLFHYSVKISQQSSNAAAAAQQLGIPVGTISIARPEESAASACGQLPESESKVMYRGRAAQVLVEHAGRLAWDRFPECPHEDLRDPGRVHLDPLGYLHICQGISIGNIYQSSLVEICAQYDPEAHPIVAPLLAGGPTELVKRYAVPHDDGYADACHLCYSTRSALRAHFPDVLLPDQMYGVY